MNDDPEMHFRINLENNLKKLGIWYKFIEKSKSTVHTADASDITGINLHKISKNLVAKTSDGGYAVLIIPGDMKLNYKQAAKALDVKSLTLVPFSEADKISGYPPGGTPSLGYKEKVDVVLDEGLMRYETFYCGGGSTRMLLELRRDDVIEINNAKVYKISKSDD
jgi:Cys-tRNA(Pro)/Cys-tRNA(Cys) deacylase